MNKQFQGSKKRFRKLAFLERQKARIDKENRNNWRKVLIERCKESGDIPTAARLMSEMEFEYHI